MALTACKECSHEISSNAASCPKCGAPVTATPARKWARHQLLATILTIAGTVMTAGDVIIGPLLILVGMAWFVVARILR